MLPLRGNWFARPEIMKRVGGAVAAVLMLGSLPAHADKIANPVAVFAGLDKITGRIISFDVYIDETVQFGALQVTPRVCYTRPPTEAAADRRLRRGRRDHARPQGEAHLHRLDVRGEPRPARRRAPRL